MKYLKQDFLYINAPDINENTSFDFPLYVFNTFTEEIKLFLYKNDELTAYKMGILNYILDHGALLAVKREDTIPNHYDIKELPSRTNEILPKMEFNSFIESINQNNFSHIIEQLRPLILDSLKDSGHMSYFLVDSLFNEDNYSNRVLTTSYLICHDLEILDQSTLSHLVEFSYYHNWGELLINRETTNKAHTKLTHLEKHDYQRHPAYSLHLLRKLSLNIKTDIANSIRTHHEISSVDDLNSILHFSSYLFEYAMGKITGTPQSLQSIISSYKNGQKLAGLEFGFKDTIVSSFIRITRGFEQKESSSVA